MNLYSSLYYNHYNALEDDKHSGKENSITKIVD